MTHGKGAISSPGASGTRTPFWQVLDRARQGQLLEPEDLAVLYRAAGSEELEALFAAARQARQACFGSAVFLYGFVYTSTFCRNDCLFCYYRKSNSVSLRYRKSRREIIEIAGLLGESGVNLVDLTMGEDGSAEGNGAREPGSLASLVAEVRAASGLPVMVSPGVVGERVLHRLSRAGASWYACYQETHDRKRFSKLRVGQSYDARMEAKFAARRAGLLIEEGVLCGLGESDRDLVASIGAMRAMDADQVRVMTFVPQRGTPLATRPQASSLRERITIAIMRLAFPDRLVPASLDVEGLKGLRERLMAGANVVTSIVPPQRGLAGVAHSSLDIDSARRSVDTVKDILNSLGLRAAGQDEYRSWMDSRNREHSLRDPSAPGLRSGGKGPW